MPLALPEINAFRQRQGCQSFPKMIWQAQIHGLRIAGRLVCHDHL